MNQVTSQPVSGTVRTADIDQLPENVSPWDVRFTQLDTGQFSGLLKVVEIDGIVIYRETWSHPVLVNGASPPGYCMLGYGGGTTWCGGNIEPGRLAISTHGRELDFVTPPESDHTVALIPESRLALFPELDPERISHCGCLPEVGLKTQRRFTRLIDKYVSRSNLLSSSYHAKFLETELLLFLNHCASQSNTAENTGAPSWKVVMLALDSLEDINTSVSIPELASIVGVSLRTLENSFKKLLGVTPLKFDHYRRLIRTHQTLRSAEPETSATVTQIATEMGFTELGRFAGQYQRMFGEQPSETLNKRSNSQPVSLADFLLKRSRQHP